MFLPYISGGFLLLNTFGIKIFRWSAENRFIKKVACLHILKRPCYFYFKTL